MSKYEITQKFKHWCAPITDTSYGNTLANDVMDYLEETNVVDFLSLEEPIKPEPPIVPIPINNAYKKDQKKYEAADKKYQAALKKHKKLASTYLAAEIIPLVEKGRQPFNEYGPSACYQTKNGKWQYDSEEYQRLKRLLFGQDPNPPEPVPPSVITVTKEPLLE